MDHVKEDCIIPEIDCKVCDNRNSVNYFFGQGSVKRFIYPKCQQMLCSFT